MVSCSNETSKFEDPYLAEAEIFESSLGSKEVYGVRVQLKSPNNILETKGFKVSFYQDNKVWIDTILAELNPKDTLESEVIFTQSAIDPNSNTSFKIESFDIGS